MNSDPNLQQLRKTVREKRLSWRSWWDQAVDGPIHRQWQIQLRPAIHLLDKNGVIRYQRIDTAKVERAIELLLREPAAKRASPSAKAPAK